MKNFFKKLKNSIFKFDSYTEYLNEKTSKTLKYYFVLILLVSVVISIAYVTRFLDLQTLQNIKAMQQTTEQQQAIQQIIDVLSAKGYEKILLYAVGYGISIGVMFLFCSIVIMLNILLMSLIGTLTAKITKIPLMYRDVFKISVYSFSFPVILIAVYLVIGILTGLTITYFNYIYITAAYIYLVTTLILIKNGNIKKKKPIGKVEKDKKKKEEPQIDKKEKNKEKKPKKKKEREEKNTPEPEGNQA